MTQQDEVLDIVDDQDNVIGQKSRSEVYAEGLTNFRVVNACVINSHGKLWIPRRSATKRVFPLHLDVSMGGHAESGESYEQALARELMEELNLDVRKVQYREIGRLTPLEHQVSAFMKVYEISHDGPVRYNTNDFVGFEWLTPQELEQRILAGEKVKGDLPKILKILYLDKNSANP